MNPEKIEDTPLMDMNDFHHWMVSAAPGARVCYFIGYLAVKVEGIRNPEIKGVARLAYDAYLANKLFLTQRRCADGYEYLATKSRGDVSDRAKAFAGAAA